MGGTAELVAGTLTLFEKEAGIEVDALVRTKTVAPALPIPKSSRVKRVEVISFHVLPPSMLNSILLETPVIVSLVPLYTAFGVALGARTVTERVADAKAEPVTALKRT